MHFPFAIAATLLLVASSASAFHEAGHKLVDAIAFSRLTDAEQQQVIAILKHHPRFTEDFLARMPDGIRDEVKNEWLFQQAAIWPDLARSFPADLKHFHHPTWHYINLPLFLSNADQAALEDQLTVNVKLQPPPEAIEEMNVVQTIRHARAALASDVATQADKALMLTWLVHCVADIHQPLHSTALFSQNRFPKGDRGGNLIPVARHDNLHAFWDQFPGGAGTFAEAHAQAIQLQKTPAMIWLGDQAAKKLDAQVWLSESHDLATSLVYDKDILAEL